MEIAVPFLSVPTKKNMNNMSKNKIANINVAGENLREERSLKLILNLMQLSFLLEWSQQLAL